MTSNGDQPILIFKQNGTTAAHTRYGQQYYIIMTCHRITDKATVARWVSDHGKDRAPANHTIKKFGFKIEIDDEKAILYRNDKYDISLGKKQWVCNIRRNSLQSSVLFNISLEIAESDKPHPVNFTVKTQIDAALAVYNSSVHKAELALREELFRIYSGAAKELQKEPIPTPNPNVSTTKASKTKVKFKKRKS